MKFHLKPWHLMLVILAGWINRQQQQRIDYLETIVTVLKEHTGKRRILLTNDQRRRIAVKGKLVGRKQLAEIAIRDESTFRELATVAKQAVGKAS